MRVLPVRHPRHPHPACGRPLPEGEARSPIALSCGEIRDGSRFQIRIILNRSGALMLPGWNSRGGCDRSQFIGQERERHLEPIAGQRASFTIERDEQ